MGVPGVAGGGGGVWGSGVEHSLASPKQSQSLRRTKKIIYQGCYSKWDAVFKHSGSRHIRLMGLSGVGGALPAREP